jgi:trk system potassium uptake protein TrkA
MYAIIIGGGKVGYYLVKDLLAKGHEVTVIERDEAKCRRLIEEFGSIVLEGDANPALLERAGGGRADMLLAVTGEDEVNLVISLVAKRFFKVPRVIARVVNPRNRSVFNRLGVTFTVSATDIITSLIEQEAITQEVLPLLSLQRGELEIVEIHLPSTSPALKLPLRELVLPPDSVLISIIRGDRIIVPKGDTTFQANDTVLALTVTARVEELRKVFY